ncbi:hypothetical protein J5N97_004108 [Dioscorea zingiberensis]|uniref:Uncharacterized protein n=1 Tax=Dioscorea zingiberensis TaxID=325984 RepID=A0A9D5D7D1_9LILI|nr:hypothetical protein J5N97_004108 [Dioscorea zingiberensis]
MGLMFRVRVSSFFVGDGVASFVGIYFLYKDYKLAHDAIFRQIKNLLKTLQDSKSNLHHSD